MPRRPPKPEASFLYNYKKFSTLFVILTALMYITEIATYTPSIPND